MAAILDRLAHFAGLRNAVVWARQDLPTTRFLGRNGTGRSCGIIALHGGRDDRGRDLVSLVPITSRGEQARCYVDVPLSDLVELVDRIRRDAVAERVAKWNAAPMAAGE